MPVTIERRKRLIARRNRYLAILDEIELAMHKINIGEAQSYTINSIQINRRNMSPRDLIELEKYYLNRKAQVEAELAGNGTPAVRTFLPVDF